MKIYTRTGDKGNTSLLGGARLSKSNIRIEAYGTVDELNAHLGLIRDLEPAKSKKADLIRIQETLFSIGSILATEPGKNFDYIPKITPDSILFLEQRIDEMEKELSPMTNFILPGGHMAVSFSHLARCVCRRAERVVISLYETQPMEEEIIRYLNRLSDYLFVLARWLTRETGAEEIAWAPRSK